MDRLGVLVEKGGWAIAADQQIRPGHQQLKSHKGEWKKHATWQLHHPGELIYFLLTSSVSADFSCNQAIASLQGKGDERLGDCSGCLLGSTWRGL